MPAQPSVRVSALINCSACDGSGIAVTDMGDVVPCAPCHGKGEVDLAVSCRTCGDWYQGMCLRAMTIGSRMTTGDHLVPIHTDPTFACVLWRPYDQAPRVRYPPNNG